MFARRRPLLRAAAVGGGAYLAGKKRAQMSAEQVPAQRSAQPSVTDQLAQLSELHEQGALTDAEFASAKSRLIG